MSQTIGFLTVDRKGRTTLPRAMREEIGDDVTQLRIDRTDDGEYRMIPAVVIPRDQLWYHGPEGRERLRAAEESTKHGRSMRTSGEAETQRYLDSLKSQPAKSPRRR